MVKATPRVATMGLYIPASTDPPNPDTSSKTGIPTHQASHRSPRDPTTFFPHSADTPAEISSWVLFVGLRTFLPNRTTRLEVRFSELETAIESALNVGRPPRSRAYRRDVTHRPGRERCMLPLVRNVDASDCPTPIPTSSHKTMSGLAKPPAWMEGDAAKTDSCTFWEKVNPGTVNQNTTHNNSGQHFLGIVTVFKTALHNGPDRACRVFEITVFHHWLCPTH